MRVLISPLTLTSSQSLAPLRGLAITTYYPQGKAGGEISRPHQHYLFGVFFFGASELIWSKGRRGLRVRRRGQTGAQSHVKEALHGSFPLS